MKLGDYLNAINYSKDNLLEDEAAAKGYVPFVVNRCLSYFPDTILQANEMNLLPNADKKMQFDYLCHSVRKRKRFSKWLKNENDPRLDSVKLYYNLGTKKALEAMSVMSDDQIDEIHQHIVKTTNS